MAYVKNNGGFVLHESTEIVTKETYNVDRGDVFVNEKGKLLVLVVILGVICPHLLIAVADKHHTGKPSETVTTTTLGQPAGTTGERRITVLDRSGTVAEISEDAYLTAVVLCEMPAEFEPEALKAQAIVARTYALLRMENGGKHENAAVCMESSCCQGYKTIEEYLSAGGKERDVEKIKKAVLETKNMVLTYNGDLIEATYFSCSGGYTEDALAVWGTDIPYLRATPSPGEEGAARYTDTVTFSTKEFVNKLGCDIPENATNWVENIRYTAGGGVESVSMCGKTFSGTTVRQLLGLRSTAFTITVVGDTVSITTKGFGHRVGMSQYGADAMAAGGSSCEEILRHYYQGTELSEYIPGD